MNNLTDVLEKLSSVDVVKQARQSEMTKQAEEEDAAGRIMARGFADELQKIAQDSDVKVTEPKVIRGEGETAFHQRALKPKTPAVPKAPSPSNTGIGAQQMQNVRQKKLKLNDVMGM